MKKSETLNAVRQSVLARNPELVITDTKEIDGDGKKTISKQGTLLITRADSLYGTKLNVSASKGNIDISTDGDHLTTFYNGNIEAAAHHIIETLSKG